MIIWVVAVHRRVVRCDRPTDTALSVGAVLADFNQTIRHTSSLPNGTSYGRRASVEGSLAIAEFGVAVFHEHVAEELSCERIHSSVIDSGCSGLHCRFQISAQETSVDEHKTRSGGARLLESFNDHPTTHAVTDQNCIGAATCSFT